MTRDDVIRMAREAGIDAWWDSGNECREDLQTHLERFASLVAAAERSDCAAVCKDEAKRLADSADRLEQRGSVDEAGPVRAMAFRCSLLKERIEDRGKP